MAGIFVYQINPRRKEMPGAVKAKLGIREGRKDVNHLPVLSK